MLRPKSLTGIRHSSNASFGHPHEAIGAVVEALAEAIQGQTGAGVTKAVVLLHTTAERGREAHIITTTIMPQTIGPHNRAIVPTARGVNHSNSDTSRTETFRYRRATPSWPQTKAGEAEAEALRVHSQDATDTVHLAAETVAAAISMAGEGKATTTEDPRVAIFRAHAAIL